MFVLLTVLCFWAGYSANWIRLRREIARESALVSSIYQNNSGVTMDVLPPLGSTVTQRLLGLFGEPSVSSIYICYLVDEHNQEVALSGNSTRSRSTEEFSKVQRVRRLFPEAEVIADSVGRGWLEEEPNMIKLKGLISE